MKTMHQTLLLAWKDLRLFVQDRLALFFALVFPLIFVAGFSATLGNFNANESTIQTVLATEEGADSVSQQVIDALVADPAHNAVQLSPADARAQVDAGHLDGYILFPQGFSQAVRSGKQTRISVVGDPNKPATRAMLNGLAGSIAQQLTNRQLVTTTAQTLEAQPGVTVDQSTLEAAIQQVVASAEPGNQPVAIQIDQVGKAAVIAAASVVLPGYVTMFVFFSAGFAAQQFLEERTNHTLDRLIASGVSSQTILAGKWLGTAARAVVQAAILWTAGVLFFHVSMGDAPLGVIMITVGLIAASASCGLFLAALVKTPRAASGLIVLFAMVLAALGGSWWPLFVMPSWMQTMAKITPHAWANDAFNRLMIFGASTGDVLMNFIVLFGIAIAVGAAAMIRVRVRA